MDSQIRRSPCIRSSGLGGFGFAVCVGIRAILHAALRAPLSARSAFRHGSADDRFDDRGTDFPRAPVARRAPVKGGRPGFSYRPAGVVRWPAAGRPLPHDHDRAAAVDDVAVRGPKQSPCRLTGCCRGLPQSDKSSDARRRVPTLVEPLAPSAGYRFDLALARLHRHGSTRRGSFGRGSGSPSLRVRSPRAARSLPQSWLDAADDRVGDEAQVRDRAVLADHPMTSKRPQA